MTITQGLHGFKSVEQARAIANILGHMSQSDGYSEDEQRLAVRLAERIDRLIIRGAILTEYVAYSPIQEEVLMEAFDIYMEANNND